MVFITPTGCQRVQFFYPQDVIQRVHDKFLLPLQDVRKCKMLFVASIRHHLEDAFCCPHRTLFRKCKRLFLAPTGCHSKNSRCFLLPPQDVIQRVQDAFCCPYRMSFKECKTFRPVVTSLVSLMTGANLSTLPWMSWKRSLNTSVNMVVCPSQSWQNPATG